MAYNVKTNSLTKEGGKTKRMLLFNNSCKQGDMVVAVNNVFKLMNDVVLGDVYSGVVGRVEEDSESASTKPVLVTLFDDTMTVNVAVEDTETGEVVEATVQGNVLQEIVEETIEDIEEDKSYAYRFLNYDGTVLQQGRAMKGTAPTYTGSTPTRESSVSTVYTFSGRQPAITAFDTDTDLVAQYTESARMYWITFNNYDSTTLQSTKVAYGETPSYVGETPTKPGEEFDGWTPEIVPVTGDATYTAVFVPAYDFNDIDSYLANDCYNNPSGAIIFLNGISNSNNIIGTQCVSYGTDTGSTYDYKSASGLIYQLEKSSYDISITDKDGNAFKCVLQYRNSFVFPDWIYITQSFYQIDNNIINMPTSYKVTNWLNDTYGAHLTIKDKCMTDGTEASNIYTYDSSDTQLQYKYNNNDGRVTIGDPTQVTSWQQTGAPIFYDVSASLWKGGVGESFTALDNNLSSYTSDTPTSSVCSYLIEDGTSHDTIQLYLMQNGTYNPDDGGSYNLFTGQGTYPITNYKYIVSSGAVVIMGGIGGFPGMVGSLTNSDWQDPMAQANMNPGFEEENI